MSIFRPLYKGLTAIVREFAWIHLSIGILGNLLFVTGTLLFIHDVPFAGWFFFAGSLGMLVNALGDFLAKTEYDGKTAFTEIGHYERERVRKEYKQSQNSSLQ